MKEEMYFGVHPGCQVRVWKNKSLMEIVSPLGGNRIRMTKAEAYGLIGQLQQALAERPPQKGQMPALFYMQRHPVFSGCRCGPGKKRSRCP